MRARFLDLLNKVTVPRLSATTVSLIIVSLSFFFGIALLSAQRAAPPKVDAPTIRVADIGYGIALHYVDEGAGLPVIFVHGSLSDGGYWADQIPAFAAHYRAIAYSRRYNYPNENPVRPGYSAVVDAEDLASLIRTLRLGKAVIVGHSYGALTALFLTAKYPQLVSALVLAEPPAVSLLKHLPGREAKTGKAMFEEIHQRMVTPMRQAFAKGDRDAGIAVFIDYAFNDPHAWENMPEPSRKETLHDAHEWDVMMTTGTLFPDLEPRAVRKTTAPVLLLSGAKSYPFLGMITRELVRLLPKNQSIVVSDAGHQMWYQYPDECRKFVEEFLAQNGVR